MSCLSQMTNWNFCSQRLSWQLWNWTLRLVFSPKTIWGKKSKFSRFFPKLETETPRFFSPTKIITNFESPEANLAFGISRIRWAYMETTSLVRLAPSFQQGFLGSQKFQNTPKKKSEKDVRSQNKGGSSACAGIWAQDLPSKSDLWGTEKHKFGVYLRAK